MYKVDVSNYTEPQTQKGENNNNSKLNWAAIDDIFRMRLEGKTHQEIANHFNMSRRHIGRILANEVWLR